MKKILLILFILFFSSAAFAVDSQTTYYYGYNAAYSPVPLEAVTNSAAAVCGGTQNTIAVASDLLGTWKCGTQGYSAYPVATSLQCPTGSTGNAGAGTCTCTSPLVTSSDSKSCVNPPSCPAAETPVGDSGYIDVGTSPISMPPDACDSGCPSQYVGTGVEHSRLVDGVKHYYVKGGYVAKAGTCIEGPTTFPREPALNADGCSSTQSSITMNGKTKCLDSDGTRSNPNSASAVSAASSSAAAANASSVAAAQAIAAANGQNASGVAAAGATAAGFLGGGGGSGGKGKSNDPVLNDFCSKNPESKICADDEFGEVEDSTVTDKEISVAITPVSIGSSGSCPAPTAFSIAGRTGYFNWTTYCNFSTGIRPILLAFAWLSAAGILIGGFKE